MTGKMLLFAATAFALPCAALAQTTTTSPAQQTTPPAPPGTPPAQQMPPSSDATPAPTGPVDTSTGTGTDVQAGTAAQTSTTQGMATATVVAATQADLKAGAVVDDQSGQKVGTIESVASDGAVVSTGKSRAQVPLSGFGTKNGTLVIGMTKAQLDAATAAKTPPKGQ
jgi:hypothetical protein